jgi:hypothetical protein
MASQIEQDITEHARAQLRAAARRRVREGMGPASAARAAIRETQALFPADWRFGVQGDDEEDFVEVWEVEHKFRHPIARIEREPVTEAPATLTAAQRQHLAIIEAHGGSVRRSWLSGWLDGVRGLRLPVIEQLVRDGMLVEEAEREIRRTALSKGMPSVITTYRIVEGTL